MKKSFSVESNPVPTNANNTSNNYVCGKLVSCLTYHKWITIWHLCKQQTTPWNAICCGILLSAT